MTISDVSNVDSNSLSVMEKFQVALFQSATQMVKDSVSTLLQSSVPDAAEVAKGTGIGKSMDAEA